MAESLMLPRAWVERIFLRLQGIYGSQFTGKYQTGETINGMDVGYENAMHVWGDELKGFSDNGYAIAYALKNLDHKFPPSVLEFRELCRRAPPPGVPALPAPDVDYERSKEAGKQAAKALSKPLDDMVDWARKPRSPIAMQAIIDLAKSGDKRFVGIVQSLQPESIAA